MKKILMISMILILGLFGCGGKTIIPNAPEKMIVAFDWEAEVTGVFNILEEQGIEVLDNLDLVSAITCYLTPEQAEALKSVLPIRYIEVDAEVFALPVTIQVGSTVVPTVENIDWGVRRIKADMAWEIATGKGIRVGVIDTGIMTTHPDLVGVVKGGINTINGGSYEDDNNHGTYIATVLGARKNGVGIVGVAPDVDLYAIKVLNANGAGSYSNIIKGYQWGLEQELDIVNMSLGGYSQSQAMEEAMIIAAFQGMATVAAAGNDGRKGLCYPARNSIAVCVGASGYEDRRISWSNYGPALKDNGVLAPGDWILAGNKSGEWSRVSGTSISTPMITGVIALLLEMKWCERRFIFASGNHANDPTESEGYGLIDARKSLEIMIKEYWDNLVKGEAIDDDELFNKMIQDQ